MTAIIRMLGARFIALFCENVEEEQAAVDAFEAKKQEVLMRMEQDEHYSFDFRVNSEIYFLNNALHQIISMKLLCHQSDVIGIAEQCRIMQERLIALSLLFDFDLLAADEQSEALPEKEV